LQVQFSLSLQYFFSSIYLVHGKFSPWTEWSNCSRQCGLGNRQRERSCTEPEPQYQGFPCFGPLLDTDSCGNPEEKCCSLGCCSGKIQLICVIFDFCSRNVCADVLKSFNPIPHGLFSYLIHMAMAFDKPSLHFHDPKMYIDTKNFFQTLYKSFLGVVVSTPDSHAEDRGFEFQHYSSNFLGKFLIPLNFKILF